MIAWRLTTQKDSTHAFNGIGASKNGGRWNPIGTKMIYCSQSISLALLENLVHVDIDLAPLFYLYEIDIPDQSLATPQLPEKWFLQEAISREIGAQWCLKNSSVALLVPSIIVPSELNLLLNPEHIDFKHLTIKAHGAFEVDKRLAKRI